MTSSEKKEPRPARARGADRQYDDTGNIATLASNHQHWLTQPCTCRGNGTCLACRRLAKFRCSLAVRQALMLQAAGVA